MPTDVGPQVERPLAVVRGVLPALGQGRDYLAVFIMLNEGREDEKLGRVAQRSEHLSLVP